MYIKTICAWCQKTIRTERINLKGDGIIISHGICKRCKSKAMKEINNERKNNISESQGASRVDGSPVL